MYYDARPSAYNGLFDTDTKRVLKGYYPFKLFSNLYRLGTAVKIGALPAGIYAAAATNGKRHGLLLTRFDDAAAEGSAAEPLALQLALPCKDVRVKQYLLDGTHTMQESALTPTADGSLTVSCPMYTVLYLDIEEN